MIALNDHISKEMNELNLIRCKHIPKRPGADWHDLPEEKVLSLSLPYLLFIVWINPLTFGVNFYSQLKGIC